MARKRRKREGDAGAASDASASSQEGGRLTPVDIQQKVFRLAFRGYNERDVDEFLDQVTEALAALHEENKRLREQLAEGVGGSADVEDARRQSEQIVREAREHAARLIEEADRRAASAVPEDSGLQAGAAGGLPTPFLLRERQFLQQLAGLVQEHARRLKEEARRARASSGPQPEVDAASPPVPHAPSERPAPEPPAGAVGAAAAAAGAPVPERPDTEEPTAPWAPVEGESTSEAGGASTTEGDELVSAWESAFGRGSPEATAAPAAGAPFGHPAERKRQGEEEPSLRELFWGEE